MKAKEVKFNDAFLFSGKELKLSENIFVKHPSIGDILSITDDETSIDMYWSMSFTLMCDPYENMVMLDDRGFDYEEVDNFDVFILQWEDYIKKYNENPGQKQLFDTFGVDPLYKLKDSLSFFLGKHNFGLQLINIDENTQDLVLCDLDLIEGNVCSYMITRDMFNRMASFIEGINCVDKSKQIHPDASFKKMLIDDMRDELRKRLKNQNKNDKNTISSYIGKVMSSLCFCGNGSISVFNVNDVKIYQLLKGFSIFNKKDNRDHLLSGIYAGNVDSSKINKKDLDYLD